MARTQYMITTQNLSNDMERSIILAHKKYFEVSSETLKSLNNAEAAIYDTVIKYFADDFCRA